MAELNKIGLVIVSTGQETVVTNMLFISQNILT